MEKGYTYRHADIHREEEAFISLHLFVKIRKLRVRLHITVEQPFNIPFLKNGKQLKQLNGVKYLYCEYI
jgi:hypothetical protein